MSPINVELVTQMQNMKMRPSKNFIRSDGQKVMAKYGLRCKFHDPKYFEVGLFHVP